MELTTAQLFEKESKRRLIEGLTDINDAKKVALLLLEYAMNQKAATEWIMRTNLASSPVPVPTSEPDLEREKLFEVCGKDPEPVRGAEFPL